MLMFLEYREPARRRTETAAAGARARPTTSATEARSPRFWLRSIRWTWGGRGRRRARMR